MFEPPIKIGVLSRYLKDRNEKPCTYYPHSGYTKAVQWMLDLNKIKHGDNEKLFHASMTPISHISNNAFSIILNLFGEAYPELGNAEGVSFRTNSFLH